MRSRARLVARSAAAVSRSRLPNNRLRRRLFIQSAAVAIGCAQLQQLRSLVGSTTWVQVWDIGGQSADRCVTTLHGHAGRVTALQRIGDKVFSCGADRIAQPMRTKPPGREYCALQATHRTVAVRCGTYWRLAYGRVLLRVLRRSSTVDQQPT